MVFDFGFHCFKCTDTNRWDTKSPPFLPSFVLKVRDHIWPNYPLFMCFHRQTASFIILVYTHVIIHFPCVHFDAHRQFDRGIFSDKTSLTGPLPPASSLPLQHIESRRDDTARTESNSFCIPKDIWSVALNITACSSLLYRLVRFLTHFCTPTPTVWLSIIGLKIPLDWLCSLLGKQVYTVVCGLFGCSNLGCLQCGLVGVFAWDTGEEKLQWGWSFQRVID